MDLRDINLLMATQSATYLIANASNGEILSLLLHLKRWERLATRETEIRLERAPMDSLPITLGARLIEDTP